MGLNDAPPFAGNDFARNDKATNIEVKQSNSPHHDDLPRPPSNVIEDESLLANIINPNKRKIEEIEAQFDDASEGTPKKPKLSESIEDTPTNGDFSTPNHLSPSRLQHVDSMVAASFNKSDETAESSSTRKNPSSKEPSEIVSEHVALETLPAKIKPLTQLTNPERKELERFLEFNKDDGWREDWIGNLEFAHKDITNPDGKSRERSKKSLFRWAERGKVSLKLLNNLIRFVYNLRETPAQAKKVLASADQSSVRSIQAAVRRVSYDPLVLKQDGWTTARSSDPIGASGGPHRIGERVFWQGFEGVVIAYVHDHDLGDLWKAMWLEEFDTFDLEAEELEDARRRFERKMKQKEQLTVVASQSNKEQPSTSQPSSEEALSEAARRSGRYASADFQVKGIEHGVVLAVSYSRGARPGVFWPARVMHFSEMGAYGSLSKRGSQKQKVDVMFLAPYWNAPPTASNTRRLASYADSISRHGSSIFSSGPLFELENIDACDDSIQEYPYDPDRGLDLDELRASFKFAGLPKAAFSRFVDSHRLALGLKCYSQKVMKSPIATEIDRTTAGLFEAHPIAAQTACFPDALLHLPFQFILAQLPPPERESTPKSIGDTKSNEEPALQLGVILEAMKPPTCWGMGETKTLQVTSSPELSAVHSKPFASPSCLFNIDANTNGGPVTVDLFLSGLPFLAALLSNPDDQSSMSALLAQNLSQLLSKVPNDSEVIMGLPVEVKRDRLKALINLWIVVKTHGEELISSYRHERAASYLLDWRRACERIYKFISIAFSRPGFGNGVSCIITDSVCNLHLTSTECFERAVRIPAALKAAKAAGAGKDENIKLLTSVNEKYLAMAEKEVVRRAHSRTYLQRMKKKCASVTQDDAVVALTEDSDGRGGEDTKGSKGSWKAAIAGVGAAVQAVDMIMKAECVNAFCMTRPPGHHAGRELHPMKAVSNGFCVLNNAACAALYATAPVSEGGPGLRRVCVIDIDVHHGNGTQDILCSTYDPRFLYVSIHAGGPDVNGIDLGEDAEHFRHHLARNPKRGVFPGRCGDTSPHQGVLNIPLGAKVTPHSLGAALMTKVTPAVEKFSPELIVVSTGFDAHKNDPLGLGGLNAEDFGTLTEVICKLAHKSCSGRVLSILEGGYGVPCCRPQTNLFDPEKAKKDAANEVGQAQGLPIGICEELVMSKSTNPVETEGLMFKQTITPSEAEQQAPSSSPPNEVSNVTKPEVPQAQLEILDLGEAIPADMKDEMPYALMKRLDKCHAEGFMECVREHISALAKSNTRN